MINLKFLRLIMSAGAIGLVSLSSVEAMDEQEAGSPVKRARFGGYHPRKVDWLLHSAKEKEQLSVRQRKFNADIDAAAAQLEKERGVSPSEIQEEF